MPNLLINVKAVSDEINSAPRGMRRAVAKKHADTYGVSIDTIYRHIRKSLGASKKVSRTPKIPGEIIDQVARIKLESKTMIIGGNREMTTEDALEILDRRGIICINDVSISTINRRLREAGFRKPEPRIRYEANHVNQEHMIDFSRSKYFQLIGYDDMHDDYILKVSGKELHYKENDKRLRLWVAHVVDTYSRCTVTKYYAATGESYMMGVDILQAIWTRREDLQIQSIPEIIKTDNGAFAKKKEVRAMCDAFQVDIRNSRPYEKDAMGKVERPWRTLWHRFELKHAFNLKSGTIIRLSELNEIAEEFDVSYANKQHPAIKTMTRAESYRHGIIAYPERYATEELLRHAYRIEERVVDRYLRISYNNAYFEAPEYTIGQRIRIYANLQGELMGALIGGNGREFQLKPWSAKEFDNYEHRPHQTYVQKMAKPELEPESDDKKKIKLMMPARKPEAAKIISPFDKVNNDEFLSIIEAKTYIARQIELQYGEFTQEEVDTILGYLGNDLSKSNVETILNQISNNQYGG